MRISVEGAAYVKAQPCGRAWQVGRTIGRSKRLEGKGGGRKFVVVRAEEKRRQGTHVMKGLVSFMTSWFTEGMERRLRSLQKYSMNTR